MGIPTDIDELGGAKKDKRSRVLWSLGTVLFTVTSTAATVSWTVRGHIADLEQTIQALRGDVRVIAKDLERLQVEHKEVQAELKAELHDVRARADNALLLAQLRRPGNDTK